MKRYIGEVLNKGVSAPVEFGAHHSGTWKHSGSPAWKLSKPSPSGFLWRLHYIGMIDGLTRCQGWD